MRDVWDYGITDVVCIMRVVLLFMVLWAGNLGACGVMVIWIMAFGRGAHMHPTNNKHHTTQHHIKHSKSTQSNTPNKRNQ